MYGNAIMFTVVWNAATMNRETKTWFWPDGTPVDESRFNQNTQNFVSRPTSKACVGFLKTKYALYSCTSNTGWALCETPFIKL